MKLWQLITDSGRFVFVHTWPILAAVAAFLPVQFALDYGQEQLFILFDPKNETFLNLLLLSFLLIALVNTIYTGLLYALVWSRFNKVPFSYRAWRDWFRPAFGMLYVYSLLAYFVSVLGWASAMLSVLIFLIAFPYLDIVILFERPEAGPAIPIKLGGFGLMLTLISLAHRFFVRFGMAIRRNFVLFLAQPGLAFGLSLARFALVGLIPLVLLVLEVPNSSSGLYSYSLQLIALPLDVAFLALYFYFGKNFLPEGFADDILSEEF